MSDSMYCPYLLNDLLGVDVYDGKQFVGHPVQNVLHPPCERLFHSASGRNINLLLKSSKLVTVTHFVICSGPSADVLTGNFRVCGSKPSFLPTVHQGGDLELSRVPQKGVVTWSLEESPCIIELSTWQSGSFIHINFTQNKSDCIDVGFIGIIGFVASKAPAPRKLEFPDDLADLILSSESLPYLVTHSSKTINEWKDSMPCVCLYGVGTVIENDFCVVANEHQHKFKFYHFLETKGHVEPYLEIIKHEPEVGLSRFVCVDLLNVHTMNNFLKEYQSGSLKQSWMVTVQHTKGHTFDIQLSYRDTLRALQLKIFQVTKIPVNRQVLVHNKKRLANTTRIPEVIPNSDTINLFVNRSSPPQLREPPINGIGTIQRMTPEECEENLELLRDFEDAMVVWDTEYPPTSLHVIAGLIPSVRIYFVDCCLYNGEAFYFEEPLLPTIKLYRAEDPVPRIYTGTIHQPLDLISFIHANSSEHFDLPETISRFLLVTSEQKSRSTDEEDAKIFTQLVNDLPEGLYDRAVSRILSKMPEISAEVCKSAGDVLATASWMFSRKNHGRFQFPETIDRDQNTEVADQYLRFCLKLLFLRLESLLSLELEKFIIATSETMNLTAASGVSNSGWSRPGDPNRKTFGRALSYLGVALSVAFLFEFGPFSLLWGVVTFGLNWKSLLSPRWGIADIERESVQAFTNTLKNMEVTSAISENIGRILAEVFGNVPEDMKKKQMLVLSSSQRLFSMNTDFSVWRIVDVRVEENSVASDGPVEFLFLALRTDTTFVSRHRYSSCRAFYELLCEKFPEKKEFMNCFPRRTMFKSRDTNFLSARSKGLMEWLVACEDDPELSEELKEFLSVV
eukprot:TRINITY_DN9837_c0_g1_i1.p1 TRINITY_DN9837_c0_g1~~TRINITY_DN9837_c0_g1_i1.p1  ORF type:complete len:862 (-),score=121.68 TRINITY_DN9837_c0_g1_i1:204-2750(-)